MRSHYHRELSIIWRTFGRAFLEGPPDPASTRKQQEQYLSHPVRVMRSATIKTLIEKGSTPADLSDCQHLADFDELSWILSRVSGLPNFAEEILEPLRQGDRYEDTLYEARAAAWHVRAGHDVRFIPTSPVKGARTPDLA